MKRPLAGFTIVELLIVIVVIAILATITSVAYNGVQMRAKNSSRFAEVDAVAKLLESYKVTKGDYPGAPSAVASGSDKKFCIGTNFPGGVCDDGSVSAAETTITDKLATIGKVPTNHFKTSNHTGPVMTVWGGGYGFTLNMFTEGSQTSDCPSYLPNLWWDDPNSTTILCGKNFNYITQLGA